MYIESVPNRNSPPAILGRRHLQGSTLVLCDLTST